MSKEAIRESGQYLDQVPINMPQMCLHGLSENWLFKYLGAKHWDMLSGGLKTTSSQLQNQDGQRLYASFVRIRMESNHSLFSFQENDSLALRAQMQRYGNDMYFSNCELRSKQDASNVIHAQLMTVFSIRESENNQKLLRSQSSAEASEIPAAGKMPALGMEYRKIKMNKLHNLQLGDLDFELNDAVVHEREYILNPYYDVNGVGLIYFAAYPAINDFCESQYFNQQHPDGRWEADYSSAARDILYYANCDPSDVIVYRLNQVEQLDNGLVKMVSSLSRKSDGALMARLFTIKKPRNKS